VVTVQPETGPARTYNIPYGLGLRVKSGQEIKAGESLTEGVKKI